MQGLNSLTMQCTYSTPCGWCAKWDKKCDKKIGGESPSLPTPETITATYDNLTVTFPVKDPDHMWNNNNEYDYKIETVNQAIDQIKLLETLEKTDKYSDSVYNSFRKEVCEDCFDYLSRQCLRSQVNIVECPKFENYFEV